MKVSQPLGSTLRWPCLLGRHFTDFSIDSIEIRYASPRREGNPFSLSRMECFLLSLFRTVSRLSRFLPKEEIMIDPVASSNNNVAKQDYSTCYLFFFSFGFIIFFSQKSCFCRLCRGARWNRSALKRSPCPPPPLKAGLKG